MGRWSAARDVEVNEWPDERPHYIDDRNWRSKDGREAATLSYATPRRRQSKVQRPEPASPRVGDRGFQSADALPTDSTMPPPCLIRSTTLPRMSREDRPMGDERRTREIRAHSRQASDTSEETLYSSPKRSNTGSRGYRADVIDSRPPVSASHRPLRAHVDPGVVYDRPSLRSAGTRRHRSSSRSKSNSVFADLLGPSRRPSLERERERGRDRDRERGRERGRSKHHHDKESQDRREKRRTKHGHEKATEGKGKAKAREQQRDGSTDDVSAQKVAQHEPTVEGKGKGKETAEEEKAERLECLICTSSVSPRKAATLKCGHVMCNSCLKYTFELSLTDETHMPPKCCGKEAISLKHVDRLFDSSFKKKWNRKLSEFSTRNRMYCPVKKCAAWVPPSAIRRERGLKIGRCPKCQTQICGSCGQKKHASKECTADPETVKLLEQAEEEGWVRCPRCGIMVERKEGCNHMTCRCHQEFCMLCRKKWKTCDCQWFSYEEPESPPRAYDPMPMPRAMTPDWQGVRYPVAANWPPQPPRMEAPPQTYQEEMERRRQQEMEDERLAREYQRYGDLADMEPLRMGGYDYQQDYTRGYGGYDGSGFPSARYRYYGRSPSRSPVRRRYSPSPARSPDPRRRSGSILSYRSPQRGRAGSPSRSSRDRGGYIRDMDSGAFDTRGLRGGGSLDYRQTRRPSGRRRRSEIPAPPLVPLGMPQLYPVTPTLSGPYPVPPAPVPPSQAPPRIHPPGMVRRTHSVDIGRPSEGTKFPRRNQQVFEETRSATLAGLTARRGKNRVSEWRSFVEPGMPEGEATAALPVEV